MLFILKKFENLNWNSLWLIKPIANSIIFLLKNFAIIKSFLCSHIITLSTSCEIITFIRITPVWVILIKSPTAILLYLFYNIKLIAPNPLKYLLICGIIESSTPKDFNPNSLAYFIASHTTKAASYLCLFS